MSQTTFLEHAENLRSQTMGLRLSWTWLGTTKTLDAAKTHEIASSFQADPNRIRATKKLLNTKADALRALTKLKGETVEYVRANSLPFPEDGVRLIRRDRLQEIQAYLTGAREKLNELVDQADAKLEGMIEEARQRLGELFNRGDYPQTLKGAYAVGWDFPSAEPPPYLATLAPEIYQRECERVRERFASAAQLAEDAFRVELAELVSHLVDRLTPAEEGTKKSFQHTTVDNLKDFFTKFKALNITGSADLNELVNQAEAALGGATPDELRTNAALAEQVRAQMGELKTTLDALVVTSSRRKIDRAPAPAPAAAPLPELAPQDAQQEQQQHAAPQFALA